MVPSTTARRLSKLLRFGTLATANLASTVLCSGMEGDPGLGGQAALGLGSLVGSISSNLLSNQLEQAKDAQDPLLNGFVIQASGRAIARVVRLRAAADSESQPAGQFSLAEALELLAERIEARHLPDAPDDGRMKGVEPGKAHEFFKDPEGMASELVPTAAEWLDYLEQVALELDREDERGVSVLGEVDAGMLPLDELSEALAGGYVKSFYQELQRDFADDGKAFAGMVIRLGADTGKRLMELQASVDRVDGHVEAVGSDVRKLLSRTEGIGEFMGSLPEMLSALAEQNRRLTELLAERQGEAAREVDALDDALRATPDVGELVELIGRDDEEERIVQLLESGCRLVTLTGPPGTGKTSLAKRIAKRHGEGRPDLYPEGCVFVRLAPLQDGTLVLQEVAEQFRRTDPARKPPTEELGSFLKDKRVLIVLDNCEHLMSACVDVIRDISNAPGVSFLATSRRGLDFSWSKSFPLEPLQIPVGRNLPAAELLGSEAVRLFDQSVARFLDPRGERVFEVSADNVGAVAEICRTVAGLPLAIEIAAARVGNDGGVDDVLSELVELVELRGGANEDGHHETMTAAVEFSYQRLGEEGQRAFRRLAVFDGGWNRKAALSMIGRRGGRLLDELVDNSLVWREGQRRSYLEPIRQVAENLLSAEECVEARDAHRDWYRDWAQTVTPTLLEGQDDAAIELLELEHDNLRRAVNWSVERKQALPAVELVAALWRFWEVRGYLVEGRAMLAAALRLDPGEQGRTDEWMRARAHALSGDATIAYRQGHPRETHALSVEALELAREVGDEHQQAISLGDLGIALNALGEQEAALEKHLECIPLFERLGKPRGVAVASYNAGSSYFSLGRLDEARDYLERGLRGFRETGNNSDEPYPLTRLGILEAEAGHFERARELIERGLVLRKKSPRGRGESRNALGLIALLEGDLERGAQELGRAWRLRNQVGDDKGKAETLDQLVFLSARRRDAEAATRVRAACDALRERIGVIRSLRETPGLDELAAAFRAEHGDESVDRWTEAGRRLSPAEAAAEVLEL